MEILVPYQKHAYTHNSMYTLAHTYIGVYKFTFVILLDIVVSLQFFCVHFVRLKKMYKQKYYKNSE